MHTHISTLPNTHTHACERAHTHTNTQGHSTHGRNILAHKPGKKLTEKERKTAYTHENSPKNKNKNKNEKRKNN